MSERNLDDVDWAPSAEQSSEDDEAQEGNWLAGEVASSEPAEPSNPSRQGKLWTRAEARRSSDICR